jgi:hypothetical protein
MKNLDERLFQAHADNDRSALITLYTEAADQACDVNTHCFFLTHAYVFALEAGAETATDLHRRLKHYGREY